MTRPGKPGLFLSFLKTGWTALYKYCVIIEIQQKGANMMSQKISDPQLGAKIAQIMGAHNTPTPQMSPTDKQTAAKNLKKLFCGLSWANWMQGMTLGAAWYTAGRQLESCVMAKANNNPAADYMRQIVASARVQIARDAMTHPHRDDLIACPDDKRDKWGAWGGQMTRDALASLNNLLMQYAPKESDPAQQTQPTTKFLNPLVKIILDARQHNRPH